MNKESLVVGIYCGDYQTVALLATCEGHILGRGVSTLTSSSSHGPKGRPPAVEQALEKAFTSAGCPSNLVEFGWIAISDLGRRNGQELEKLFYRGRLGHARLQISSLAELIMADSNPQGWGITVCSGYTSLVVGKNLDGEIAKSGGWGALLGESGSAYAIGMSAVQYLTRAADGRSSPTILLEGVLRHWKLANPRDLYRKVYLDNTSAADFVDLIGIVFDAAKVGDKAARAILIKTAKDLAGFVAATVCKLDFPDRFPCSLFGSILSENLPIRQLFLKETKILGLNIDPLVEVKEPAFGAVRLAISTFNKTR